MEKVDITGKFNMAMQTFSQKSHTPYGYILFFYWSLDLKNHHSIYV